jgi:hypothetical protein
MKSTIMAVLLAVSSTLAAPQAHADGPCTGLYATNTTDFAHCIMDAHANCTNRVSGVMATHMTCTYADGSRDECDRQSTPWFVGTSTGSCQYVPPGQP